MEVNYIKHLEAVTQKMSEDKRLNATHVSMYLALFLIWNHNRFQNPLSVNRSEVMKLSKIGSQGTYHKCMTDLDNWGYFKYVPSHDPYKGSLIYMFNFCTSSEQVLKQPVGQLVEQVPVQLSEPSINNIKHNKHINITNKDEDDLKIVPTSKSKKEIFLSPSLKEAILFFKEKNKTDLDAEKFFNHFESNGWLVGGKSKMKNWQAAARNWISRSEEYNKQSLSSSKGKPIDRLNTVQNKDYSIPL